MSIAAKRHMLLGRDYFERGFYQDAIRELLEAVKLNPDFPDLHNQLGLALSMNGDRRDAADEFRRALELNPHYVEARLNLAIVYNRDTVRHRDFTRSVMAESEALGDLLPLLRAGDAQVAQLQHSMSPQATTEAWGAGTADHATAGWLPVSYFQ